jgi:GNAT superfamily N-acetyltransferase
VNRLLETVWPGFARREAAGRRLGCRWERISTPFVRTDGEGPEAPVVAHVGVLEVPVLVEGRPVRAGGVHAVATHPDHRGRGHARALLETAVDWAAPRYDVLVLTTEIPALYESVGFRAVPEHRFHAPWRRPEPRGRPLRLLDREDARDVERLGRLLAARDPVSERLGIRSEKDVFLFDEALRPLRVSDDLDAVASLEVRGETLHVWDVLASRLPPLEEVLARVPEPFGAVVLHLAPDRLAPAAAFEARTPWTEDEVDLLMVRGPFAAERTPFAWPRSGRC